ncbi:hydrogenase nickel incorporation protein HypB [Ferrimonas pelagia]|uniref:Hydrogenase maturation factor HypB n=1 Tax=Ferrimonas pelagia TaxID=1177826 RepID=A0ABP9EKZ6_9GAMM
MCTVCGCAEGNVKIEGEHGHSHDHQGQGHSHGHEHDHDHHHPHPRPAGSKVIHKTVHRYQHQGDVHHHYHFHVASVEQAQQLMADPTQHSQPHSQPHSHPHSHLDAHQHEHAHQPEHQSAPAESATLDFDALLAEEFEPEEYDGELDYGQGPAHAHAPGMSQQKMVQVEMDILGANDALADANRARFDNDCLLVLNLVSSPGSGKTTLLTTTVDELKEDYSLAVIEGDQETANDAERIRATGVPAVQVNTGKGCHLDAAMVGRAADQLDLEEAGILFIENVGNLVCPAEFDLGEDHKIAILSVTEGEDKPLKYPDMFAASDVMLITKTDLLPYVEFDVEACIANARQVNPEIEVFQLSSTTGEGMEEWLAWVAKQVPVCA